jgi:hypothetical protein
MASLQKPVQRLALIAVAFAAALAAPAAADAEVAWLCRPGFEDNPCQGDQTTTHVAPDGASRVDTPPTPADPPIDCFYVYPTVSNQPTRNATATADPEVRSIAVYQAQRFSTRCRVYAPLYRQVTAAGITMASQTRDTTPYSVAFEDVREAWLEYLKEDNRGRGFVLLGHSQGSRHLRALIRREIDGNPEVRARLVSAIIPGANATVAKGRRVGGDFENVPACDVPGQTGCVVSYSTFNETPPDNARYGRTDTDPIAGALDLPTGEGLEVLCTNPAALAGAGERLDSLLPSEPFAPGVIAALLLKLYGGPPPSADTPWLEPQDHYTGRCETSNGANVLMISPVEGARRLEPSPDDTWGVHLVDVNIALGNLTAVVGAQERAWLAARRPGAQRKLKVRVRRRARRLIATVAGPPAARVRVTLRRRGRKVRTRVARIKPSGRVRVRFRPRRPGRYRVRVRAANGELARSRVVRIRAR